MTNKFIALLSIPVITIFVLAFPRSIMACTYEATISGSHLDFKINSELDKLAVIQYIRLSGSYLVTKTYSPDIGVTWSHYSDFSTPNCGLMNGSGAIVCVQNGGTGTYWSYEQPLGIYHLLPGGVYGIDFDSPPTYDSIGIEYGILQGTTGEDWRLCTRTGNVVIPTPTPVTTPVLTPTPILLTKTVFAPGITASWNAEALLNCQNDTNTDWVLAPYAEDVYYPLLTAIQESGWDLLPFYYDWRKNPVDTSQKLAVFIDENTETTEKVNFVGHSMGGLVGKSYLDTSEGSKLAKFLSVGTPYKGSAFAYPPWEGGDVWSNNLLEKIGITLYIKRCGGLELGDREMIRINIPSLQSLLPVEPYLQTNENEAPYLPADESNQNNWFNNISSNSWGVRVGNMAGIGFETLKAIKTKDPNKKDLNSGNWIDGKPAGRTVATNGDGTVLSESAILDMADEKIIINNQTHRGLVNSVDGVSKILEFLGLPESTDLTSMDASPTEPDSALIVIGYPANFIVTDMNGKSKSAKDGMVAIMNPTSGKYRVNLLPKSNDTLLIVAQFLPNGDVKYKEYNFKGVGPKFKSLDFDPQNPRDNILTP